ncbi:MAG TPA: glutamate-1-semialdehyde 2,1-aminomutase, partial [Candidatus Eremiobacteraceae bacterium]|nr:glutamate-1-semialdehyde 2,1-aminomutase [Candidatus Eremiobacteraceae bacterium]
KIDSPTTHGLETKFPQSTHLREKSHAAIPGGAHTYSKGDDQFPEQAPGFILRGKGCHVWDVDGNEFIEYGMGLRSVTLGHAYESVVEAAHQQMLLGCNFTRPAKIELDYAEDLLTVLSNADMVKFAKNGSDVTTAAVKLARAYTGRDLVALCEDHPFFSVDDWFIGHTQLNAGIPQAIRDLTISFRFNDLDSVKSLFERHKNQIACIILEPATAEEPKHDFLVRLKELCDAEGSLLILDEMITGFRWHLKGAQAVYGVVPHLATFGKAMSNGFALAALAGRRDIMELGGLRHPRERVFLLSTTHGAETHALAAAWETLNVYRRCNVIEHLYQQGERLRARIAQVISRHRVGEHFAVLGRACNLIYATKDAAGQRSQPFRTLFLQEMIRGGVIAPSFVVSFSHSEEDIDRTVDACDKALGVYAKALQDGVEKYLVGRPVRPVDRKFN